MRRIAAPSVRCGLPGPAVLLLAVLAPGPALAVDCGEVITGVGQLDRNLVCTTDPALTVEGGRLDLGAFTVACDHEPETPSVGILLEGTAAQLRNGAVTGCAVAVWIGGSGEHRVVGVTASASNQGVFVESDGNLLLRSHVLRLSFGRRG